MASTLTSPGVLSIENDQSFITQQPITVGAAIIGPTVLGPVEIPTIVTSYSDYKNKFGSTFLSGSQVYTYFTSIAAFNYFNNGGESLLVARVVSGTFTSAFTSASAATNPTANGCGILNANNSESIVLSTLSQGTIMNSSGSLDASGSLNASGSQNNIRWQIVNNDTSSGTFSLLIREGDDNTNNPVTLETWTNLSMDPTAPNYVSRVLGNQVRAYSSVDNQITVTGDYPNASKYVYVSSVKTPTPLYFDNTGIAKSQFTALIPVNASGSFTGATGDLFYGGGANYYSSISSSSTNTQGISASNYGNMINLLSNQDDYRFNVLMTPGLFAQTANLGASQVTSIINNTMNRGDNIYVSDLVPFNATITEVTAQSNAKNTSYAASYWPWVQTIDPDSAQLVWVPASTMIGGVYAYNDSVSEPWFAPAGINRGGLSSVVRAEKKLSQANRDTLYTNKVNPIATFPGTGVVVYGQKTLQTKASALDRVNVRRLLIALKSYIGQVANNLVFEQNTIATRTSFLNQVNPYLESVQQRQGLYAFKVVMDSSNNTPDVIDRNQLVGQIYLQPTKTAEFVYLNFNILPTGVSFPA
jgi:phage tail sheath protein FI